MKRIMIFMISVTLILSVAGCSIFGRNEQDSYSVIISQTEGIGLGGTEDLKEAVLFDAEKEAENREPRIHEVPSSQILDVKEDTDKKQVISDHGTEISQNEPGIEQDAEQEPVLVESTRPEQESVPALEPEPSTKEPVPEVEQQISYDPGEVVSLAISKCQAGGMVTTTDNLDHLLAEGKITQEQYDQYYPYDGLGYYSVFVETDLNKASALSGRRLGTVAEIAGYIADMLLLETEPLFHIGYAGVHQSNGTDFYEFRCYR